MTTWEPATEAERAMRDALQAGDQARYFRVLARTELLLPEADASLDTSGWGTWRSEGRIHILAFTSTPAMRACLSASAGAYRQLPFEDLAAAWPDQAWWLAVNPGLPIEGYLPAWFVGQISVGDVRLPGRTLGAAARIEHARRLQARSATERPQRATPGTSEPLRSAPPRSPLRQPRPAPSPPAPPAPPASPAPAGAPVTTPAPAERKPEDRRPRRRRGAERDAAPTPPPARTAPPVPPAPGPAAEAPPVRKRSTAGLADALSAARGTPDVSGRPPEQAGAQPDRAGTDHQQPAAPSTHGRSGAPATLPKRSGSAGGWPVVIEGAVVEEGARPQPAYPGGRQRPATIEDLLKAPDPAPTEPVAETDKAGDSTAAGSFTPANGVEENLLDAANQQRTDRFLSTLLLAKVLVPDWNGGPPPEQRSWATETIAGSEHLVAYTSLERMVERRGPGADGGWIRFTTLISSWPGEHLSFAVNPDTPVGATLPGNEIVALADWAAKMGLTEESEPEPAPEPRPAPAVETPDEPLVMQKSISPRQVSLYLKRGYDRVSGFVHRAAEVDHLCSPEQIYRTLGLSYSGSTFRPDAAEVYLLRWRAYRGNLYRIPYGGRSEAAMRAVEGWVIERAPFRGDGSAPSETDDVIAEFKVDSVRLPHGAQLWRLDRDGNERLVALLDADGPRWRLVGG